MFRQIPLTFSLSWYPWDSWTGKGCEWVSWQLSSMTVGETPLIALPYMAWYVCVTRIHIYQLTNTLTKHYIHTDRHTTHLQAEVHKYRRRHYTHTNRLLTLASSPLLATKVINSRLVMPSFLCTSCSIQLPTSSSSLSPLISFSFSEPLDCG